ncbi:MAG: hypothetical protein NTY02_18275, partial [Acidobacteria bacterium]|nr:hypothetical protein [Acidobacteriota bacterium]
MIRRRIRAAVVAALVWASLAAVATAAPRYDPRFRFRVWRTQHFLIYYHQGETASARRLARVAEEVRADLLRRLGVRPPGRTHVVLVDQTDLANGWSTPIPYNTIEIDAALPAPSSYLGNHDDWLRMVFSHEFAHILH